MLPGGVSLSAEAAGLDPMAALRQLYVYVAKYLEQVRLENRQSLSLEK